MEKIQSHEIKDIWRVRDGLLVEIYKYESLGHHFRIGSSKGKIMRGCKGLKVLKEDVTDGWSKKTYPKGTFIYYDRPVKPTQDVDKFKAEIKSSGGSILDSLDGIDYVLSDIKYILNQYR